MSATLLTERDNVIVADDEPFSRQIVIRFLRDLGNPNIVVAKNGAEAIAALLAPSMICRLVISDFNMPVRSGLDLLKFIRSSTSFVRHDIPFLMLTGLSDRAVVGTAMALDVCAFVVKPVSKAALETRIASALSESRALKNPQDYAAIDVTTPVSSLLKHEPVGLVQSPPGKRNGTQGQSGRRVSLDTVQPGAVLAEEIRAPSGELLLARGAALSPRLISRLRDMVSLRIPIEALWVEA